MPTTADSAPRRLLTPRFLGLCLLIFLAYCNITVFYSLYVFLETITVPQAWRGLVIGASSLATIAGFLLVSPFLTPRNAGRVAAAGMVLLLGCGGAYLLARSTPALLAVRLVNGLGVSLVSASAMALLVSVIPPGRAGAAFGLYSVAQLLPYSAIPPLFDLLSPRLLSYDTGYAVMALAMLPALVVSLRLGRAGRPARDAAPAPRPGLAAMAANARRREMALLLGVNAVYYLNFTALFFLAKSLFLSRGMAHVGFFFAIQTGLMIGIRLFANRLFDAVAKVHLIRISYALTAASFLALYAGGGVQAAVGSAVLLGLGMGVGAPSLNALMFRYSPPQFQGLNANLMMLSLQVGNFLGPFLGNVAVGLWGYGGFLLVGAAAGAAGIALSFALPRPAGD